MGLSNAYFESQRICIRDHDKATLCPGARITPLKYVTKKTGSAQSIWCSSGSWVPPWVPPLSKSCQDVKDSYCSDCGLLLTSRAGIVSDVALNHALLSFSAVWFSRQLRLKKSVCLVYKWRKAVNHGRWASPHLSIFMHSRPIYKGWIKAHAPLLTWFLLDVKHWITSLCPRKQLPSPSSLHPP